MMMAHGVNTRDCDGWTPLHHAIHKNLPKMAEKLLENGADPKANCRRGISSRAGDLFTPLQFAVMSKQHHVVKFLLKFHDPIEIKSIVPRLGLIIFDPYRQKDMEMARIFLDHSFEHYNWMRCMRCARYAIRTDQHEWIKLFLDYGFEVDKIMNGIGRTGLEEALERRRPEIVKLFLQYRHL